jgi:hypothetical protein
LSAHSARPAPVPLALADVAVPNTHTLERASMLNMTAVSFLILCILKTSKFCQTSKFLELQGVKV